jgi:hypothetical protein
MFFNTWDLGLTPSSSDFESLSDLGLHNLHFLKLRVGSLMIDRGTAAVPVNGSGGCTPR